MRLMKGRFWLNQCQWKSILASKQNKTKNYLPQFYIQLVYKPHFGAWILLFGPFGQLRAVRKKVDLSFSEQLPEFPDISITILISNKSKEKSKVFFIVCKVSILWNYHSVPAQICVLYIRLNDTDSSPQDLHSITLVNFVIVIALIFSINAAKEKPTL